MKPGAEVRILFLNNRKGEIYQKLFLEDGKVYKIEELEPYPPHNHRIYVDDGNFTQDDGIPCSGVLYLICGDSFNVLCLEEEIALWWLQPELL